LTVSLGGLNVDSSLIETRHSLISMLLINDVHQFVAGLEALSHKRQHHAILFFFAGKKRARVARARLQRPTDAYRLRGLFHRATPSMGK
jgi:hypothetical protein